MHRVLAATKPEYRKRVLPILLPRFNQTLENDILPQKQTASDLFLVRTVGLKIAYTASGFYRRACAAMAAIASKPGENTLNGIASRRRKKDKKVKKNHFADISSSSSSENWFPLRKKASLYHLCVSTQSGRQCARTYTMPSHETTLIPGSKVGNFLLGARCDL